MQIHNLTTTQTTQRKRVGRGGKKGTYSGRGMKGQKSRAGARLKPSIREVIKRYPKMRGYRTQSSKHKAQEVNVLTLEKLFASGETVSPASLIEKRAFRIMKAEKPRVKILGTGAISKAFTIQDCEISAPARKKILEAGGTVQD